MVEWLTIASQIATEKEMLEEVREWETGPSYDSLLKTFRRNLERNPYKNAVLTRYTLMCINEVERIKVEAREQRETTNA
jgi:hypothetical protein